MTVQQCLDETVPSTLQAARAETAAATAQAVAAEQREVVTAATGSPAIESAAGNALRDFLTRFLIGMENGNLSDEGDALTLDYNLRLNDLGNRVVKVQGVLRKATLWEPFAAGLDSDTTRDKLAKDLDDFDDVTLTLTYAPEGARVGRMLEPHRPLFDAILNANVQPRQSPAEHDELLRYIRELRQNDPAAFTGVEELEDLKFQAITNLELRERLREKTLAVANAFVDTRAEFDRQYNAAGLNLFSDLLNNQPQFYLAGSTRERNALAGPRERTLRATYEMGFVNLNDFKTESKHACDDPVNHPDPCAAAYAAYVARPEKLAGANASNRVALSLEYTDLEDYDITAADIPNFHVDGTRKWSGSFAYGRVLLRQKESAHDGRVDFGVTYEDLHSKASEIDNRWIASAIYTQKISDTLSLPIGLVWSSHEDAVPNSDQRVSAHFGLVFKMPTTP
jgi:hypothetical protein